MEKENYICPNCKENLQFMFENEDGKYFYCKNCKAVLLINEDKDFKNEKIEIKEINSFSNKLICPRCHNEIFIGGNFMFSDIDDDIEIDEDFIITNFNTCDNCGLTLEVFDCSIEKFEDLFN